jgi:hypothetical protein
MGKYEHVFSKIKHDLMKENGELEHACYEWIHNICKKHKAAEVNWEDVGYDVSSYGKELNKPIDINQFKTIEDFLNYPTGASLPTYEPGSGMRYEIWEDEIYYFVSDYLNNWVIERFEKDAIEDEDFPDNLCDSEADILNYIGDLKEKSFPKPSHQA